MTFGHSGRDSFHILAPDHERTSKIKNLTLNNIDMVILESVNW